jgi:hypothetical protein
VFIEARIDPACSCPVPDGDNAPRIVTTIDSSVCSPTHLQRLSPIITQLAVYTVVNGMPACMAKMAGKLRQKLKNRHRKKTIKDKQ